MVDKAARSGASSRAPKRQWLKKTRRLVAFSLIVLAAVALAVVVGDTLGDLTGIRQFEDSTLDLRQQTTPESFQAGLGDRESEVVLVLFDEFSVLDTIDGWKWITPFPRAPLAELIDALSMAGAKTIGVDVFLGELFPGLNLIDGGNDLLRDAMERAGNVIIVAPVEQTDSGPIVTAPHPFFAEVAAGVGSAELPSSFETFRDGSLAVRSGNDLVPSFALAMYAHSRGLDVDSLLEDARRRGRFNLPGLPASQGVIPTGWFDGRKPSGGSIVPFRIRYLGPPSSTDATDPPGTFQSSASSSVSFMAAISPELFEDKIVLLGTGFHAEDRFRTPFFGYAAPAVSGDASTDEYEWMYGVEIHANALQNLIDGAYVRPLGAAGRTVLLFLLAGLTGGVAFWYGATWGAAAAVIAIAGTWTIAFWAWAGVVYVPGAELFSIGAPASWVPIGTPILAALSSYVLAVAYVSIIEGKEKRFIKGAFGKYLSPDVVAEISEDPSALQLGGEKRPLSLLFSDLSGFTTMSEEMDAQDLIALLNEYLNDMTHVVFDEGGYLDKYIGDAIMAFWNAPKEQPDHHDRAMRTAILMQRRMNALNEGWAAKNPLHEPLKVRIGVHSGEVVVGNVGGEDRFDYSAIGDSVNLAARLEPANKTYDTLNMVSEVTLTAGQGSYRVRELDLIAVKGKEAPVKVFELLELAGVELEPSKEAALKHYELGMTAYKQHDWATAREHFATAVSACPEDGPSRLYVTRCTENMADPPPADWDFVVRRTEK
ncbi:MAG: adenylate/guanylate cyclase domain-containing protein [Gemmatimonadetes bacterium]|nr:adenylate/guanylate cyclase domain-containing protein [Gemmatimonadota bacterium]MDA1103871.1 adenylate/guanylate cyclase domain-containing protein [Gemmatimonadota bacterium]